MRWFDAARARLRLLLGWRAAESRMADEFRFHIDMETEKLVRESGLDAAAARRRALIVFGGTERYGEELREGRGPGWLRGLSLDLRLGVRMLLQHPGLALVGGFGMAVAIAIAGVAFGMINAMMDPSLPLPEGDRIVMLQNMDARLSNPNRATHLHDLEVWRAELRSVQHLGAYRLVRRSIMIGEGDAELVRVAEMSAAGFTLTGIGPLLGRPLVASDERPGAADVVVIGEDAWRNRFAADSAIVGRAIRLGSSSPVVVGVMPSSYRFPVNEQYWVPLRLNPADYEAGAGPSIDVFGKLAAGASLRSARAELETIARRLALQDPEVHATISPQVMPYTYPFFDVDAPGVAWAFRLVQLLVTLLLVVVGVNVAILMYARTTTRLGEITVRTALGASRRRIVLQLFAESLVLSSIAAAAGLATASSLLSWVGRLLRREFADELPFWLQPGLSPGLALYASALAVVGALIVGAVPALKATGRQIQAGLRTLGTGGTGLQLGRTWTLLVIGQVAIAVAILPAAVHNAVQSARHGLAKPGYPAIEFMQARLGMERVETPPTAQAQAYERAFAARFAAATAQLIERLSAEPEISDVTYAERLHGEEPWIRVEVDGAGSTQLVARNAVAADFFRTFDMQLLAGRGFDAADVNGASMGVIVDRTFVEKVLGGGSALGRTLRYSPPSYMRDAAVQPDRQYEIVGVVADFPDGERPGGRAGRIYHALAPAQAYGAALVLRMRGGDATGYERRLRAAAMESNAALELHEPMPMSDAGREMRNLMRMIALAVVIATISVVLLSAAGIYSMMAFTVARRRREIGIRSALGAAPAQLLRAVFSRAAAQLAAGVAVGIVLAAVLDLGIEGRYTILLAPVAALMLTVGLLAAAGPARRGLRIQPTEALRED